MQAEPITIGGVPLSFSACAAAAGQATMHGAEVGEPDHGRACDRD
jgi:hypothetical protein